MILEKLKAGTQEIANHAGRGFENFASDHFSRSQYIQLLMILKTAHDAVEVPILKIREIYEHPELNAVVRLGKRHALLLDLHLMSKACATRIPKIFLGSPGQAWGALYLLEIININTSQYYTHLCSKPWWKKNTTCNYCDYYGHHTAHLWCSLNEMLEEYLAGCPQSYPELMEGATRAGRKFEEARIVHSLMD